MRNLLFLLLAVVALAQEPVGSADVNATSAQVEAERNKLIAQYREEISEIDASLSTDSLWIKSYSSYLTYLDVRQNLNILQKKIAKLSKKRGLGVEESDEIAALRDKEKILAEQVALLKGEGTTPFASLLKPEEVGELPSINNPFDIFTGMSFVKTVDEQYSDYMVRLDELKEIVGLLQKKAKIYKDLDVVDNSRVYTDELDNALKKLDRFETALNTVETAAEVYEKRIEEIELNVNNKIKDQLLKLFNIGIIILVLFIIFFLIKLLVKKYITDNERFYMANKIITFVNVTIVILVIFFNYIENVGYFVTVLGFASAGIAIAMKDWFMSILGWLVIVLGGSIHVGDRVRFVKDGNEYVGDVLDISLLRITVMEDVTLVTYMTNRRAGRVVFVPNNYIFTSMVANYSHASLKTVWDGIDVTITFDSNHKKATHLAKEICRKYSKGYTDITRKQLNKLRNRYSLKNTNVEPRIFTFIEPNGIQVSSWYLTNAYATLTLRSAISTDIIDAFNAEDDITIAFPTQKLYMENTPKQLPSGEPEPI